MTRDAQTGGERARDDALSLLGERRARYLTRLRRAFLRRLLDQGDATIEDVRPGVPDPEGIDPRAIGAWATPFARRRPPIIAAAGYERSAAASRHARAIQRWRLIDRAEAEKWLAEHPEPDPLPHRQGELFGADGNPYAGGA